MCLPCAPCARYESSPAAKQPVAGAAIRPTISQPPLHRPHCLHHNKQPTIYQSRLLNFFGTFANETNSADRATFIEVVLEPLIQLSYAKDATVRWRFCQLLHALMGNLPPETELDDPVMDAFESAMLDRLEDGKPTVRAVAVRALARLPDPGSAGDFSDCELTRTLIDMLASEKSKAVRKAVLATLPHSDFTRAYYIQRTRDEADDVSAEGWWWCV